MCSQLFLGGFSAGGGPGPDRKLYGATIAGPERNRRTMAGRLIIFEHGFGHTSEKMHTKYGKMNVVGVFRKTDSVVSMNHARIKDNGDHAV
jgi:hypothetical protein